MQNLFQKEEDKFRFEKFSFNVCFLEICFPLWFHRERNRQFWKLTSFRRFCYKDWRDKTMGARNNKGTNEGKKYGAKL